MTRVVGGGRRAFLHSESEHEFPGASRFCWGTARPKLRHQPTVFPARPLFGVPTPAITWADMTIGHRMRNAKLFRAREYWAQDPVAMPLELAKCPRMRAAGRARGNLLTNFGFLRILSEKWADSRSDTPKTRSQRAVTETADHRVLGCGHRLPVRLPCQNFRVWS